MKEKYWSSECFSPNTSACKVQVASGVMCSLEQFFVPRSPHYPFIFLLEFILLYQLLLLLLLCASVWNCNAFLKDFDAEGWKSQGSLEIFVYFCVGGDFINSAVFLNFLFSCASRNGCSTCLQSEIGESPFYFGDGLELKRKNHPYVF